MDTELSKLSLLERSIVTPFLNEDQKETIAIYPGAFKPPHRGHLSVVEKANKLADKTIVLISNAPREDVEAEESLRVWEIYTRDMPNVEVKIAERSSPVAEAYSLFKHNPEKNFVMTVGKGEVSRLDNLAKYDNAKPFDAGTLDDLSATRLRQAIREGDKETIQKFIPEDISVDEYLSVFNQALVNEDHYPEHFLQDSITSFAQYMEDSGMNIAPPPRVEFIEDDEENAADILGKTAHYNPQEKVIVLYTLGRHPKDILRSFAHEMIHHIQNLEGRLGNIQTTNTNEDSHLDEIEREAYEKGNITFRNWTDSILNEKVNETKMDNVPLEKIKNDNVNNTKFIEILNRFPEELQRELLDERPNPKDFVEDFSNFHLKGNSPKSISLKSMLNDKETRESIGRTPQKVVDAINKKWGTDFKSIKVYDQNPDRYFKYAKFSGETAKPSLMVNGEILFGVGRFIAALIRGDKTIKVWDIIEKGNVNELN